jgi:dienelactone hydrolase
MKYLLKIILIIPTILLFSLVFLLKHKIFLPKPTGIYSIGTKEYYFIDENRNNEEFGNNSSEVKKRELMVKIFYPSDFNLKDDLKDEYAPYFIEYISKNQKLNYYLFFYDNNYYSNSKKDIPISLAKDKFPVLIFSSGLRGTLDTNTIQCEELASHGYIVISISHPYNNAVVEFSNGKIIEQLDFDSNNIEQWDLFCKRSAKIWLEDSIFVLNKLEDLCKKKDSFFYNKFDMNKIGAFGHSMGGSTALQLCKIDKRIKAAVNIDGSDFGPNKIENLNKPIMIMCNGNVVDLYKLNLSLDEGKKMGLGYDYLPNLFKIYKLQNNLCAYLFYIKNTGHFDFSDGTFFKESSFIFKLISRFGLLKYKLGILNGEKVYKITNKYLLSFFDKYLNGEESELIDNLKIETTPFEDVEFIDLKKFNLLNKFLV